MSSQDLTQIEPFSVTMVNNLPLPTYSTERYYMLSEIELKGNSTLFLCDYACDNTADTAGDSEAEASEPESPFPSYVLLYILWRPDMEASPNALTKGIITESVKHLKSLTGPDCQIYLVVDSLTESTSSNEEIRKRQYLSQVQTVERLARCVATSKELRDEIQGLTVGISNHIRAAPGLEKCMEAMCWGSKDRRKNGDDSTSSIGIVAQHPDDLIGLQKEPDAAQGVLQSYTGAEWNGNGDLMSFAKRIHVKWCANSGVTLEEENLPRPKRARPNQNLDQLDGGVLADPITLFIFLTLAMWLYMHITSSYDNGLVGFLDRLESILDRREVTGGAMDNQL